MHKKVGGESVTKSAFTYIHLKVDPPGHMACGLLPGHWARYGSHDYRAVDCPKCQRVRGRGER